MKKYRPSKPELFHTLKHYNKQKFTADLMAGIIVGIVALPLAIAFGIASGVSPEKGILTAIIAGFAISAFGGSRVQIGGPTGAFIVIIYGIIQQYGLTGLAIATVMAGLFLILLGGKHTAAANVPIAFEGFAVRCGRAPSGAFKRFLKFFPVIHNVRLKVPVYRSSVSVVLSI